MPHYLISIATETNNICSDNSLIINAKNQKEAIDIFAEFIIYNDDLFMEDFSEVCVNMSFCERFFLQTEKESSLFCESGEILIDDEEFKKRVYAYFPEKAWSDIFLNYFFTHKKSDIDYVINNFPKEMLIFAWKDWIGKELLLLNIDEFKKM